MHPEQFSENPESREGERFRFAAESIPSEEHPERNEDTFFVLPERSAAGVFDGVSGTLEGTGGDIAASLARTHVQERLANMPTGLSHKDVAAYLLETLGEADQKILKERRNTKFKNMATTGTVAMVSAPPGVERRLIVAHVGDSRVYISRPEETLEQVTLDDGLLRENRSEEEARLLQEKLNNVVNQDVLSDQERGLFDWRNIITQSLGNGNARPAIYEVPVNPRDRLLMTTDGIHDNLTDSEIEKIVSSYPDPEASVHELTVAAITRSHEKDVMTGERKHLRAKPDDMTAIIVEIPGKE